MIDRYRSLIHMLMAGLVGLTLGLFIGWWVWPVQWIETPAAAPATAPAASAPAQSVESPAEENRSSDSDYSALMDWVNQGLLYVAAALLLVGGVVIGYQLLRQSQDKDSKESPFPLPFSRRRSNQATAARDRRAHSPPLAGRPTRPRQPTLNWLRRETESENPANTQEPVFREQSFDGRQTGEHSPASPAPDRDTSHQEAEPQEQPVEAEREPGEPLSHGPPEAEIQESGDWQDGAPTVDWDEEEPTRQEPETVEIVRTQGEMPPATHSSSRQLGRFEANYAFGIQTYDESFTINAADGELLGACGMGINESVDRAAANSDRVRLLDVWLYDRSAVQSVSQSLVSPGFDVSGLDNLAEDSDSDAPVPLDVRPGLTCTLRSDHLVLDCKIESATFLDGEQAPTPFRSVSASLTVYVQPQSV
jgi:hypothetical protein